MSPYQRNTKQPYLIFKIKTCIYVPEADVNNIKTITNKALYPKYAVELELYGYLSVIYLGPGGSEEHKVVVPARNKTFETN